MFSIVVGVVPVVLNGALALLISRSVDLSVLFGRGELLMLAVGLAATTVGDVVAAEGLRAALRLTAVGASFALALVTTGIYGIVLTLREINPEILSGFAVAVVSLTPYIIMVLLNGACIVTVKR